jgi:SAM-dependent methyltransferase
MEIRMATIKNVIKYLLFGINSLVVKVQSMFKGFFLKNRIEKYRKNLRAGEKFKVIFGGHWGTHSGWLVLSELEQNIIKPLNFADDIVDVVFTEHVIEHVSFMAGVAFLGESKRILKPGGVFRIVFPSIERLLSVSFDDNNGREYLKNSNKFYYKEEKLFAKWNFDGLNEFSRIFLLNRMFTGYGHKFIWSANLMHKVLKSLGYKDVNILKVGQGHDKDYCIERRRRGVYLGNNWQEDRSAKCIYDPESLVVEAIK